MVLWVVGGGVVGGGGGVVGGGVVLWVMDGFLGGELVVSWMVGVGVE